MTIKDKPPKKPLRKNTRSSKDIAYLVADAVESKKAEDIEILDVRRSSSISNYLVLCTAASAPQLSAVADAIEEALDRNLIKGYKRHGKPDSNWIIVDLINVVAHIMHKDERHKYKLEELWGASGVTYHV